MKRITSCVEPKSANASLSRTAREHEYEFVLIVEGITQDNFDVAAEALYEAGCDDATPGISNGIPMIAFSRSAKHLRSAVLSAIRDVGKASRACKIPMRIVRVDANHLASLTQIADRSGKSRQMIHYYLCGKRGAGKFPLPLQQPSNSTLLWRWSEVAHWLYDNRLIAEQVVEDAEDAEAISLAITMKSVEKNAHWAEIEAAVGMK